MLSPDSVSVYATKQADLGLSDDGMPETGDSMEFDTGRSSPELDATSVIDIIDIRSRHSTMSGLSRYRVC